ncbi:hypothetical protein LCGC14_2259330 [marine sediment metagenome]|uniref:Uncharacterized protein n=1 Tax=marine sediment metagenome TaxID=412755 RepID=A0A0F9FV69_9ZZZZ
MIILISEIDFPKAVSYNICKEISIFFSEHIKYKKCLYFNTSKDNIENLDIKLNQIGAKLGLITDRRLLVNKPEVSSVDGFAIGIGRNICFVSQLNGLDYLPLLKHELAHCYGVEHCSTPGCLMAKDVCNGKYCWKCGKCQRLPSSFCKKHNI